MALVLASHYGPSTRHGPGPRAQAQGLGPYSTRYERTMGSRVPLGVQPLPTTADGGGAPLSPLATRYLATRYLATRHSPLATRYSPLATRYLPPYYPPQVMAAGELHPDWTVMAIWPSPMIYAGPTEVHLRHSAARGP